MGAEYKEIGKISIVTDHDVGYYEIGELAGGFQEHLLEKHIKAHGHEGLSAQLSYMHWQLFEALRKINGEEITDDCKATPVSER